MIPAYKRPDQLARCLGAVAEQTVPCKPVVYDNSTDNIGFTAAVNTGLRVALAGGAEYAVSLNQDCYLRPDAVAKAIEFMEAHPRCAVLGVKQLHDAEPDFIVHGGCSQAFPYGVHVTGRVSAGDCAEARQFPWVNGACQIFRMAALREIGLMDEGYFLIGSDADICFTARLRGWEAWYSPDVACCHEGGASGRPDDSIVRRMRSDMTYFADKWINGRAFARLATL